MFSICGLEMGSPSFEGVGSSGASKSGSVPSARQLCIEFLCSLEVPSQDTMAFFARRCGEAHTNTMDSSNRETMDSDLASVIPGSTPGFENCCFFFLSLLDPPFDPSAVGVKSNVLGHSC